MRSIHTKFSSSPPKIPDAHANSDSFITDTLKITTITPMTGGGFSAGRFDPARPVRVPSIRGHLRNWFRLMNQEGESELFGSTDKAGKVYVDVKDVSSPVPLQKEYRLASPEYYALFSVLNRKTQETIPFTDAIADKGLSFTLSITYPADKQQEIRLALSAWIFFGGLGARTRRGCGSLYADEVCGENASFPGLAEVLESNKEISLFMKPNADELKAWTGALTVYKSYRQFKGDGTTSLWPDVKSIRAMKHMRGQFGDFVPEIPRAALGLPLNFDSEKVIVNTPSRSNPDKPGRMASPVITKALCVNGKPYSAVIILPHDEAFTAKLYIDGIAGSQRLTYSRTGENIIPMNSETDAISGLETYIQSSGFRKELA